ncbi:MAG: MFS transporter [SAR324 cluster bacterium]|nr:MFS transporter [SAR324 cluster bacterium]MBL7034422.1 MFS transporter [SAR324 cluster bacterium]
MGLIIISFVAFISLGLPDGLLGVAWPGIRDYFDLPVDALGIILICGTGGYMLSSFLSGMLMRRLGIGKLLSLSCAATASSLFVYAITSDWWIFVIFVAISGLGAGAIDAGINTFVAKYHSSRMMQWLHASFGVGITSGPVIMTLGISLTSRWQSGYLVVSLAIAILAAVFFVTKSMWIGITVNGTEDHHTETDATLFETLKIIPAQLSMLLFFLYTGVELGLGLWTYSLLTESRGVAPEVAGFITGSYWGMFTIGRIIAGLYASRIADRKLIYLSVSLALLGIGLLLTNSGQLTSILGIGLVGFAIAPIFPGLVSNTTSRVGRVHQANTIGLQIAAAGFGVTIVPSLAGVLARHYGLEVIPFYLLSVLSLMLLVFVYLDLLSEKSA